MTTIYIYTYRPCSLYVCICIHMYKEYTNTYNEYNICIKNDFISQSYNIN